MSEEKPDDEERKAGWPAAEDYGKSITQASEMEVEGNEQLIAIFGRRRLQMTASQMQATASENPGASTMGTWGILNKLISTRGRVQLDLETTNAGLHRFHQGLDTVIKPADPSHSYPSDVRLFVEGTLAAESRAYPQLKGDDHCNGSGFRASMSRLHARGRQAVSHDYMRRRGKEVNEKAPIAVVLTSSGALIEVHWSCSMALLCAGTDVHWDMRFKGDTHAVVLTSSDALVDTRPSSMATSTQPS
ncbi:hypothetical protein BDZ89DRAFT_1047769 [Hymenopellis radicata]|nr:hypothetical protein BDZ89DRAFT_1047769 [Hymenopellis radicata]